MNGGHDWRLVVHDSLPSTSDSCIARAEAGEEAGLAILALQQTRARGSRGRGWIEPPAGNLAMSVLLRPEGGFGLLARWPLLAGLALHQALSHDDPDGRLSLKWPNDLMLDGCKLGGILIERGANDGHDWLVIGFGANLLSAPELPDRVAACMAELGPPPSAREVAARLLVGLDEWIERGSTHGFAAIRSDWLDRAHPIGTPLAVRDRGEQRAGSFAGLSTDGALLLDVAGCEQRIDTGEILLLGGH
ncbi:biotin--[acetyl-CoA-carboxylase] ligase [Lichenicola cladoniae]|uniref:Biotin--[acetyl-CoA-carboxylase] ligase n=1 Tax=Lichenicola cladoniae TaxID=1484109 RepID=A0A6M8HPW7_9PROT|nr:biotin--[acetyl-CoA-carboxylase] ligase [Lichenicola cladoniae]NPD67914.1 biotin--[acetyl-CoA-carboxylase] ligase [Acetobacteraceae bacterium]QKE90513.1 biotin--[acetyl-CoA-carboxylase] ligase [Lichenicola cladoniae]